VHYTPILRRYVVYKNRGFVAEWYDRSPPVPGSNTACIQDVSKTLSLFTPTLFRAGEEEWMATTSIKPLRVQMGSIALTATSWTPTGYGATFSFFVLSR